MTEAPHFDFDYIIIGSGFGGSVAAFWLSEKGYRVLILEKGKQQVDRAHPGLDRVCDGANPPGSVLVRAVEMTG